MSMAEVAKLAGVSHATVSRVINNRPGVSPQKMRRVREAMRQLNYTPPARRRGPQPKTPTGVRTGNIAVLFVGTNPTLVVAPIAAVVLHAVEEELASRGFNMIFGQVAPAGRLPPNVQSGRVDGLLMHGYPPKGEVADTLRNFPTVWLLSQRRTRGYWGDRVSPDNHAIGCLAAEYLVEAGHKHLAFLHGSPTHLGFDTRAAAFAQWARDAGATPTIITREPEPLPAQLDDPGESQQQIDDMVDQLLALSPRPTGVFVPRDRLTVRVFHTLRAKGVRLGRDMTLVSCDNDRILGGLEPRPATIDLRPGVLGKRAVDQLVWRMENPHVPVRTVSYIEPQLVRPDDPLGPATG